MRTTSAPADSGTERHVTIGLEGNVDEEYSGDYDPEAIADFSGSIGDYSGDNGPEGIWDFSGSIGDYPGDNGPEGIWDFSGSLGDYSGDYAPENTGEDYSGSGDYGPEGIADSCEDYGTGRYAEYCGLYGPENVGPGSTHTPTPQWGSPTFLTPVVFLILAVQLSVVVFLVVRGRKEKTFRQGFYLFFVAVTLVESLIVLMRRDMDALSSSSTVFGLPYEAGFPFTNVVDLVVFTFVSPIIAYAQSLLHLVIVITRFTAFCFPLAHSSAWSSRNVLVVFIAIAAGSVSLGVGPPAFFGIRKIATNCSYGRNGQRAPDADWFCSSQEDLQDVEWQSYS
ncbi:hypothetical protein AAVH_17364, partial [Aphelenchoides avenae]